MPLLDNRWEVNFKKPLGEGGFGQVYRGKDTSSTPQTEVAAKRVALASEGERKAFADEVGVLRRVSGHPSIIRLHGDASVDKCGWMFLEMATGGELFDRLIDSGSLSERAAWPYVRNLAQALDFCASKGVIHRDIKLENVMLCGDDPHGIRLIDFGLAVQLPLDEDGHLKHPNIMLTDSAGTQAYRAPEVSSNGYDPFKVDVWALGILTFSLCSGFFPMQEAKLQDWRFAKFVKETQDNNLGAVDAIFKMYKRKNHFSPELTTLIDHMLLVDPKQRWSVGEVVRSAWLSEPPGGWEAFEDDDDGIVYRSCSAGMDDMDCDRAAAPIPDDAVPLSRQRAVRDPFPSDLA